MQPERFGRLGSRVPAVHEVFRVLERACNGNVPVLLTGETGTGKDEAARSLHELSDRARGPFVVVDCGATGSERLFDELFGPRGGEHRAGAFALADGGTLLLNQVDELAAELQPRLLRTIESRRVQRWGSSQFRRVDVRVIAATSGPLRAAVRGHQFYYSLYQRLRVIEVDLVPLRKRLDDLPLLVDEILNRLGIDSEQGALLRSEEFLTKLRQHKWPGNVRELRNYLERCMVLGDRALHDDELRQACLRGAAATILAP